MNGGLIMQIRLTDKLKEISKATSNIVAKFQGKSLINFNFFLQPLH